MYIGYDIYYIIRRLSGDIPAMLLLLRCMAARAIACIERRDDTAVAHRRRAEPTPIRETYLCR